MAIKPYEVEGQTFYMVYVNVRSSENPALRVQRKLKLIKTERDAKREEIRLIRECERELAEKTTKGALWGNVIEAWEKKLAKEPRTGLSGLRSTSVMLKSGNYSTGLKVLFHKATFTS